MAYTSTRPLDRFFTYPARPRRAATPSTKKRKPTPCTEPDTKNRLARVFTTPRHAAIYFAQPRDCSRGRLTSGTETTCRAKLSGATLQTSKCGHGSCNIHRSMLQWNFKPAWRVFVITTLACALFPAQVSAQKTPTHKPVGLPAGVQIVSNGGEPELRVDGLPYFIHAAQFDYFRIPPSLWFRSLDRYRELGINTIDLRIPWNWHEIGDGEFDFDGHTNLRRNLRDLLQLIAEKHLKLIARPGPLIGDQWRNAGYPSWLLGYSDYKMNQSAIEAGLAPADGELATRDG